MVRQDLDDIGKDAYLVVTEPDTVVKDGEEQNVIDERF